MINGTLLINVGSITYAYKAQKLLLDSGIPSTIGKSTAKGGGMGCSYGLNVKADCKNEVMRLLSQHNIKYFF